jgi:hypothetical protein
METPKSCKRRYKTIMILGGIPSTFSIIYVVFHSGVGSGGKNLGGKFSISQTIKEIRRVFSQVTRRSF